MSEDMEKDLLDAFRQHRVPTPERATRNWEAIESAASSSPVAPSSTVSSGAVALAAAGGLIALGLVLALRPESAPSERAPAPTPQVEAPAAATSAAPVDSPTPQTAPPQASTDGPSKVQAQAVAPPAPKASSKSNPKPKPAKPSMADEVALIARAKSELSRGEFRAALASTREHAKVFPQGRLVDERKLLRVRALCGAGKKATARKEVDRYLSHKPDSAISDQMRRACP